jgi:UDP-N-acetylmuramoyl-L-alanyl-D-glutamate--2,6-diaminopimelate ligase
MNLGELFEGICEIPSELREKAVSGVTSDSRSVREGFLFVCIKGRSFDGHSAAKDVLAKGAAAVVTERKLSVENEINVENTRAIYSRLLSAFHGRPTRKIKLGAVTGTNGKTTTVNLCAQITRALGHQTAVIGTLGTDTGRGLVYSHEGPPTTPEPHRLYELFAEMAEIDTEYCFMEASSQALAQYRFAGERFSAAAFTNLSRDHLDYHGTMENYYLAKRMLFDMCENAVINIDDEHGRQTADYCRKNNVTCFTTSVFGEADYFAETVKLFPDRAEMIVTDRASKKSYPVKLPMTGYYNVSNAIQAAVMCAKMGFDFGECLEALEQSGGVSGRLETLYSGKFTVIRDYAHTEDGLEKLLSTLKPLTKGRLICLFAAAGERDAGKRPAMGEAAARYSDYLVVTTDSPRHESPQQTIDDVVRGIHDGVPYSEFVDRTEAVHFALEMAGEGDLVALCGKGHEDYQAIGDEYFHFDEKEIVDEWIKGEMK